MMWPRTDRQTTCGSSFTVKVQIGSVENRSSNADLQATVFDVSKYIHDHPGGAEIFSEIAGADGSDAFDNAQHSEDAMKIKSGFRVGRLEGANSKKQATKVVRLLEPSTRSMQNALQTKWASQGVIALSTGLLCFIIGLGIWWIAPKTPTSLPVALKVGSIALAWRDRKTLGFTEGVLVSFAIFALSAYLAIRPFQTAMEHWTGQWRYESHLKLPTVLRPEVSDRRGWLDPVSFQKLALTERICLGPNAYLFVFNLPKRDMALGLPAGQHVSIRGSVNGRAITRSYTPISSNADLGVLKLVVRVYDKGVFTGGYLRTLAVGDEVEFRGPKGGIRYRRGMASKLGMVAGGTGITPMYQLIRSICEDPRDTTQISLVYANKTHEDCLLHDELSEFARIYPRNLKAYYVLERAPVGWQGGVGFVTREILAERLAGPSESCKVAICGPPPMVESVKKSLGELGFRMPEAIAKPGDEVLCF